MKIPIKLQPLGKVLQVAPGAPLRDVLFLHGVEFPCGGRGRCKGCRVRVLDGALPVTSSDRSVFSEEELSVGWRLSCRASVDTPLVLELAQWESSVLGDNSTFPFVPREGLGVAVDLGTTTICAQLLDLRTGKVLGVRSGLNAQARFGADLMSRIEYAVAEKGQTQLTGIIRRQIYRLIRELLAEKRHAGDTLSRVIVVGNTAMHHLFCGIDLSPLSHYPFEPLEDGLRTFRAKELKWSLPGDPYVFFLPCLGGFVGSDLLAGILATGLHESEAPQVLVDLGTNGEMVVGHRAQILCASTAAGPAFEGARISMGMRAATGAISEAALRNDQLECHVIGGGEARGLCGSGLVDVVAAALDAGTIRPSGRLIQGESLPLSGKVSLTQTDIRELQLAKGAIAAGLRILAAEGGVCLEDRLRVDLAGAFGNYINRSNARRIGLLPFPPDLINSAGNTALLGAKIALFQDRLDFLEIRSRVRHVSLSANANFQDVFVEEMTFPMPLPAGETIR